MSGRGRENIEFGQTDEFRLSVGRGREYGEQRRESVAAQMSEFQTFIVQFKPNQIIAIDLFSSKD